MKLMHSEQEYNLDYLATALEEATNTIRTRMDELSLVRRVGDAISSLTSTQGLCVELVNALGEMVNCRYISIYSGSVSAPFQLQAVASLFSLPEQFPQTIEGSGSSWSQILRFCPRGPGGWSGPKGGPGSPVLSTRMAET